MRSRYWHAMHRRHGEEREKGAKEEGSGMVGGSVGRRGGPELTI